MKTENEIYSDLAIPPGDYLEEIMEGVGISKSGLALRMGIPINSVSEICAGEAEITPEIALQLKEVTDVPAHIWLGLEQEYRETLARNRARGTEEAAFLKQA